MQTLAQIPFFKGTTDLDFPSFDRRCAWKRYTEGETILDYEDESSDVYFIRSGEVRMRSRPAEGEEEVVAELAAGEFFGEMSAIDGVRRPAHVTALSRAELCVMPVKTFRDILFTSRMACDKVLRLLASRVREAHARPADRASPGPKHLLYSELLRLSRPRNGHPGERVVTPAPFPHVVAARIGCRREQVSQELSAMASEGLVAVSPGGLVLLKPKVLEARIAQAPRQEG